MKIPKLISAIFNPSIVTAYILLIYFSQIHVTYQTIVGAIIFFYVIPWGPVLIYWIRTKRSVSDMSPNERNRFIVIALISYCLGATYFTCNEASEFLVSLNIAYAILSLMLIIGNLKSKPSIHISGFVTPVILLAIYTNILLILLLSLVLAIGWSRIKLQVHTPNQIILGFIMGLIAPLLGFYTVQVLIK